MKHFYLILILIGGVREAAYVQNSREKICDLQYLPDQIYAFKMRGDGFAAGRILDRTATAYQILSLKGDTSLIAFSRIKKIIAASPDDIVGGEYWPTNPFNHKYWVLPSGFTPGDGQARLSSYYFFTNALAVGIGANTQVEVVADLGLTLNALLTDRGVPSLIHYKFIVQAAPRLRLGGGLGTIFGRGLNLADATSQHTAIPLGYALVTWGGADQHVTLSYLQGGDKNVGTRRFVSLSAAARTSANMLIFSENWSTPMREGKLLLLSLGVRNFKKKASLDVGVAGVVYQRPADAGIDGFVPFPFVGFSARLFGKRR